MLCDSLVAGKPGSIISKQDQTLYVAHINTFFNKFSILYEQLA